jgi:hypothetical protein
MANEIGVSQLTAAIPDIVRETALQARYAKAKIMKKVLTTDADVAKKGDRVSLPLMPSLSVNDVGSSGSVTRQQLSVTAPEVVVDKWKECTVDIADIAAKQSAIAVLKEFSGAMGAALGAQQDSDLGALYSTLTGNSAVGSSTSPTPMDDSMLRLARQFVDDKDIPEEDRVWVLSPSAHNDLLALARFTEAQNTGFSRGVQIEGGRVSRLYGDEVVVTTKVATTGSARANLYIHKEALGMATQKNFAITPLAKVQLSEAVTGSVLYGVKVVRSDHGVVIYSLQNSGS